MDAESVRQFGIDDDKKGFYVRLDDAKSKMAPPAGAKCFERHGEALRRSDGNLEQIGILRPWLPPDFRFDITEKQRVEILRYVNECWMRESPLALQARGRKFAEIIPAKFSYVTRVHARALLDEWFRDGVVANEKIRGNANRHGLRVTKTEILKTKF